MSFTMRTSCPGQGNKNFIRTASGGWNTCIKGSPTHQYCDVLANCVGYASGRFNEIINNARGTTGCTYKYLNCNAENFVERAKNAGLSTGSTPRRGAIMCWQKGSLASSDGAGHVAIVEQVYDNNHVYTSESGYGSSYFWNSHRYNSNGRWGIGSGYSFRCFIYLPSDVQKIIDGSPAPTPGPSSKFNIGDEVIINGPLYVSSNASSPSGNVSNKKTKITRKVVGAAHPYNTTGDLGWMDESSITKVNPEPPKPEPTPTVERKGLDLSSYQAGISFDAIKNSEYNKFVILRGGFTGWGTGVSYNKDSSFETFYSQAKSKGIPVGCYWFSCANTYEKGVAEANFLYENCLKGKQFEYPIYMDVEDEHWQKDNKDGVTAAIKGFCETLEAKKYYVGIYGSDISGFKDKMHLDQLTAYDKWVARYGSKPSYVTSYGMWQTSSTGKISGYNDNLDTDIAYKDYETIIKNAKLNGYGDGPAPEPPKPEPPKPEPTYKFAIGDSVVLNGPIYVSSDASKVANTIKNKHTKVTRIAKGAKHPYNTTGDLGWCDESSLSKDSGGGSSELKAGDTVKILDYGNANSLGTGRRAGGIGWTRKILRVYSGRAYPYQVGNNSGTTGFYKASALRKQ